MCLYSVSRWPFLFGLLLAVSSPGAPASADELNSAFVATFGKSAPLQRLVRQEVPGATGAQADDISLLLSPQFLVRLENGRYALVINEATSSMRAEGAPDSAVSIA
jgi:hypothetical protein